MADRLQGVLKGLERPPKVFILRMRKVPVIDASGLCALKQFYARCKRQGTVQFLSGVHAQPLFAFVRNGFNEKLGSEHMFGNLDDALDHARQLLGLPPQTPPEQRVAEVARER